MPIGIKKMTSSNRKIEDYGTLENISVSDDDQGYNRRWISVRFAILVLVFVGMINYYTLRVNISVTILEMVDRQAVNEGRPTGGECALPTYNDSMNAYNQSPNGTLRDLGNSAAREEDEYRGPVRFNWNERDQGLVLGSFFYGYVVTNLFGGRVAEIFGAKWVFGLGILGTSVLTLLTPLAAYNSLGSTIVVRITQGFLEGFSYPAMNTIVSRWVPMNERSFSFAFIYSGSRLGSVIAYPIAGALSQSLYFGGWPTTFYFFGAIGVLWFVLFFFVYHEMPEDHPYISKAELRYILKNQGEEKTHKDTKAPWKLIFTSVGVWIIALTDFCEGWGFNTVLNDLPTYMANILHFDTQKSGLMMALPYLLQVAMSWLSAMMADFMISKKTLSRTNIRKLYTVIGEFVPAACILGAIFSKCEQLPNVIFFILAVGFNGFSSSGYKCAIIDMAPDYSGCILGLTNAFGSLPGFITPSVTGAFTIHGETLQNWHKTFWVSFAIYILGGILFLFGGTAKLQPWGVSGSL